MLFIIVAKLRNCREEPFKKILFTDIYLLLLEHGLEMAAHSTAMWNNFKRTGRTVSTDTRAYEKYHIIYVYGVSTSTRRIKTFDRIGHNKFDKDSRSFSV